MDQPTVPQRPSRQGSKGPQVPEKDTELPKVPLRPIRRVTKSEIDELGDDLKDFPLPTIKFSPHTSEPDLPTKTPLIPSRPGVKAGSPIKTSSGPIPVVPSRPEASKQLPEIPRRPTSTHRASREDITTKETSTTDLTTEKTNLTTSKVKELPEIESTTNSPKGTAVESPVVAPEVDHSGGKGERGVEPTTAATEFDPSSIETNPKILLGGEIPGEASEPPVNDIPKIVEDTKTGSESSSDEDNGTGIYGSSKEATADINASVKSLKSVSLNENIVTSDEDDGNRTPATTEEKVSFKTDDDVLSSSSAFDDDVETVQGENAEETVANDQSELELPEEAGKETINSSALENIGSPLKKIVDSSSKSDCVTKVDSLPTNLVNEAESSIEKPIPPPKDEDKEMHEKTVNETKPAVELPSIPRRPTKDRALSMEKTNLPQEVAKEAPKQQGRVPPPKPKKLSSKIAAFQDLFNQNPPTKPVKPLPEVPSTNGENEPKVPRRPAKFTGDRAAFALNLQGIVGRGIALPGMVNPMMLQKKDEEEAEAGEENSESKEVIAPTPDARKTRAKGPRGKRLPKAVLEAPKVEQSSRFSTIVQKLWSVNVQREGGNGSQRVPETTRDEEKNPVRSYKGEEKLEPGAEIEPKKAVYGEAKQEADEEFQSEKSTPSEPETSGSDEDVSSSKYVPATEDTGTCLSPVFQGSSDEHQEEE